ncbi:MULTISPECIES: DUF6011 domain-containing protein [Bacillaceae]|uniref:DUF6011 domain-containing protein n=1 Tax=Shouchella oshimensis TaxID=290588 RepID=UPI000A88FE2B|nr:MULTISPECIES: DUF6011 domain-containing protein [Bacillaceae]
MTDQYIECRRCGRELKDKRSREMGYGPSCIKKVGSEREGELETVDLLEKEMKK